MQVIQPRKSERRPSLYDQVMEDYTQAIRDAVSAITAMTDRKARARAASDALKLLSDVNASLSALRQEDIKALREAGMSYRQIGEAIGVHFTRVKQIESGVPTGNSSRARAAKLPERPPRRDPGT